MGNYYFLNKPLLQVQKTLELDLKILLIYIAGFSLVSADVVDDRYALPNQLAKSITPKLDDYSAQKVIREGHYLPYYNATALLVFEAK